MASTDQQNRKSRSGQYTPQQPPPVGADRPLRNILSWLQDELTKIRVAFARRHDWPIQNVAPDRPNAVHLRFAEGSPGWDPGQGRGFYYYDPITEQWVKLSGTVTSPGTPPAGGLSDHGGLGGLGDDDHTQYHNDARGDVRYFGKSASAEVSALTLKASPVAGDYVLGEDSANSFSKVRIDVASLGGGGGVTTFDALTDTPSSKTGKYEQLPAVNLGETALEYVFRQQKENGFVDEADSTLAFVDGTRTFTIAPAVTSFEYFNAGQKYTKSASENVVIPDAEGLHFIYYNGATLSQTQTFSDAIITDYAFVCAIYWDATNSEGVIVANERHGQVMDSRTHLWRHHTEGTAFESGLALGDMSVDGTGNAAADAQFSVSNGIIWDEDIKHTITDGSPQDISPVANLPILYRDGANGYWRKMAATTYPIGVSATPAPYWNEWTGAVWQRTALANNKFVLVHYIALGDINTPVMGIMGQAEYNSVSDARAGAEAEARALLLGDLDTLSPEYLLFATVIWEHKTSYTNAVKARVRSTDGGDDYIDWRGFRGAGGSSGLQAHSHNLGDLNDITLGTLADGEVLTYDATAGYWKNAAASGGGASVTLSTTAPVSPSAGDMWIDTTTYTLYVYYNDGDSSQWVSPNAQAVHPKVLLQEITNATAGEFDFDSIDQSYNRLIIEGMIRGGVSAASDNLLAYFNADTTDGNYHRQAHYAYNGSHATSESAHPYAAFIVANSGPANEYHHFRMVIEDYTGSYRKKAKTEWYGEDAADSMYNGNIAIVSAVTDALTRVRIRTDNHPTDGILGTLRLYGEM